MGKKGASSWFSAVKRAFMSPTKDNKSTRRRELEEPNQEDEQKVILLLVITPFLFKWSLHACARTHTHTLHYMLNIVSSAEERQA